MIFSIEMFSSHKRIFIISSKESCANVNSTNDVREKYAFVSGASSDKYREKNIVLEVI